MDIKQRIIEGAGELFFSRGIRRVTMDELARELGMSKRTIYENFNDKTEVLEATQTYFQRVHEKHISEIIACSDHVMEVILRMLR